MDSAEPSKKRRRRGFEQADAPPPPPLPQDSDVVGSIITPSDISRNSQAKLAALSKISQKVSVKPATTLGDAGHPRSLQLSQTLHQAKKQGFMLVPWHSMLQLRK